MLCAPYSVAECRILLLLSLNIFQDMFYYKTRMSVRLPRRTAQIIPRDYELQTMAHVAQHHHHALRNFQSDGNH